MSWEDRFQQREDEINNAFKREFSYQFPKDENVYIEISTPEGWDQMIHDLCSEIDSCLKEHDIKQHAKFVWVQIKEKFGGLRAYYDIHGKIDKKISSEIALITDKFENLSFSTCMTCGSSGSIRRDGWITVFCDQHFAEWKKKREN